MMPGLRVLWLLWALWAPGRAGLYSPKEPLVILDGDSAARALLNSSSAWLAEYYATWCGHCQSYSPTWKQLARDVQDWRPAVYLAVLDCAEYPRTCTHFGVRRYPTLKFFQAFSKDVSSGTRVRAMNSADDLRLKIIDNLEQHKESWPPACPPLEPASVVEIQGFFNSNNVHYLALVFEDESSYLGREVTLDMLQYENITVRRVLPSEALLLPHFGVKTFPSAFLLQKSGAVSHIRVTKEDRSSYRKYLRSLQGVRRGTFQLMGQSKATSENKATTLIQVDSSKVYMADLESALHYSLRVEVAKFPVLDGEQLTALKNYVRVLAEYYPARPLLGNLLRKMDTWLHNVTESQISFSDFENVLNNRNSTQESVLMADTKWVWCQGTEPHFRGFPCSFWTLFHVLTVESAAAPVQGEGALDVLSAMRGYVKNFFGCQECAGHFESMAAESLGNVSTRDQAIEWLWARHNQVNLRLSGALSEDPRFPKLQWPTPDLCPLCQREVEGEHFWNIDVVVQYLKSHYSRNNIKEDYLLSEPELLKMQRENERKEQETGVALEKQVVEADSSNLNNRREKRDAFETEDEAEEEDEVDEEEEHVETQDITETHQAEKHHQRPSIIRVGSKFRGKGPSIVDLDSFVDENYKRKALRAASAAARRKHHASERGLKSQRFEEDLLHNFDYSEGRERRKKRDVDSKYLFGILMENEAGKGQDSRRHWIRMIELGFSRLDLSLCIVLYLLSSMCLLAMYLYFHMKTRCRKLPFGMK